MDSNNHIHLFKDIFIPSTCKENGYILHKCDCGYEHKDNFRPLIAHSFDISEENPATCTEEGSKKLVCSVCGETATENFAPKGHLWGDWKVQQFPTCTEEGRQLRFCANCGTREDSSIPAKGHNLTSPKKSETEPGMIEYFCDNCGETLILPAKQKKSFFKKHKKAFISIFILLILAAGVAVSAKPLLIPFYHYTQAKVQIKQGNYAEAYYHLNDCIDFKDSRSLLRKFTIAYESTETIFYDSNGKKTEKYKYEYDEYGNITSEISLDQNGKIIAETEYKNEYDENGNLIKKTVTEGEKIIDEDYVLPKTKTEYKYEYTFNEDGTKKQINNKKDGKAVSVTKYEYTADGKLSQVTVCDENGKVTSETKYEYDDKGNLAVTKIYTEKTITQKLEYNKKGFIISQTDYNENGDITTIQTNDDKGNPTYTAEYDENGNILLEFKCEYEYDKKGKFSSVNITITMDDEEIDPDCEINYNDNGDLTYATVEFETDDDIEVEFEIEYEYDNNGTIISYTQTISDLQTFVTEYDSNGIKNHYASYKFKKIIAEKTYSNPIILYNPETP